MKLTIVASTLFVCIVILFQCISSVHVHSKISRYPSVEHAGSFLQMQTGSRANLPARAEKYLCFLANSGPYGAKPRYRRSAGSALAKIKPAAQISWYHATINAWEGNFLPRSYFALTEDYAKLMIALMYSDAAAGREPFAHYSIKQAAPITDKLFLYTDRRQDVCRTIREKACAVEAIKRTDADMTKICTDKLTKNKDCALALCHTLRHGRSDVTIAGQLNTLEVSSLGIKGFADVMFTGVKAITKPSVKKSFVSLYDAEFMPCAAVPVTNTRASAKTHFFDVGRSVLKRMAGGGTGYPRENPYVIEYLSWMNIDEWSRVVDEGMKADKNLLNEIRNGQRVLNVAAVNNFDQKAESLPDDEIKEQARVNIARLKELLGIDPVVADASPSTEEVNDAAVSIAEAFGLNLLTCYV